MTGPAAERALRFAAAWDRLAPSGRVGLAVSGGPDSLALLSLAHRHAPDRIEVATVDHRLRSESAEEAVGVAAICAAIGVRHAVLADGAPIEDGRGLQAAARVHRYRLLGEWAAAHGLAAVATAHHADDQAETLLMRLARGAGLAGMSGIRARQTVGGIPIVRPLLGIGRAELAEELGVRDWRAADDPSNRQIRFDRTRARGLLTGQRWLAAGRIADTAQHLAEANEALDWAAARAADGRIVITPDGWGLDPAGLPRELLRRLTLHVIRRVAGAEAPLAGPEVMRLIERLRAGRPATLAGVLARPGPVWTFRKAPPHRSK